MQGPSISSKILFAILVLLIIVGSAVYFRKDKPSTLTKVGQIAPDFEVTTIDGDKLRLSDLRGKVVLTAFFATWCPPCQAELPLLEKTLWTEFKDAGLLMIAIAREQTAADVRPFQAERNLTFIFATDPNRKAFAKYATEGIPRTYLIAPDGTIAYQSAGYDEEEIPKIKQIINQLLNKP